MIRITEKSNLLALFKPAPAIVHRNFIRCKAGLGQLACQLNVEFETVALQFEPRKAGAPEYLEHRDDVGGPLLEKQVVSPGKDDVRKIHEPRLDRRTAVLPDFPAAKTERARSQDKF